MSASPKKTGIYNDSRRRPPQGGNNGPSPYKRYVTLPSRMTQPPGSLVPNIDPLQRLPHPQYPDAQYQRLYHVQDAPNGYDLSPTRTTSSGGGHPPPPAPRSLCVPEPLPMLKKLQQDLDELHPRMKVQYFFDVDNLMAIRAQECTDRDRKSSTKERGHEKVFGVLLREVALYHSVSTVMGDRYHDIPYVVYTCIEELYRTGLYQPNLFRDLPNRNRLRDLVEIFNNNPKAKESAISLMNDPAPLRRETTADVCAVFFTYLSNLPEPVLTPSVYNALWAWCVSGDLNAEDENYATRSAMYANPAMVPFAPIMKRLASSDSYRSAQGETPRMSIAQHLLHLLPVGNFSLLVYLMMFFTQVVMMRDENGMGVQDVGDMFGLVICGQIREAPAGRRGSQGQPSQEVFKPESSKARARITLCWLLNRWGWISERLFELRDSYSSDVVKEKGERERLEKQEKGRRKSKGFLGFIAKQSISPGRNDKRQQGQEGMVKDHEAAPMPSPNPHSDHSGSDVTPKTNTDSDERGQSPFIASNPYIRGTAVDPSKPISPLTISKRQEQTSPTPTKWRPGLSIVQQSNPGSTPPSRKSSQCATPHRGILKKTPSRHCDSEIENAGQSPNTTGPRYVNDVNKLPRARYGSPAHDNRYQGRGLGVTRTESDRRRASFDLELMSQNSSREPLLGRATRERKLSLGNLPTAPLIREETEEKDNPSIPGGGRTTPTQRTFSNKVVEDPPVEQREEGRRKIQCQMSSIPTRIPPQDSQPFDDGDIANRGGVRTAIEEESLIQLDSNSGIMASQRPADDFDAYSVNSTVDLEERLMDISPPSTMTDQLSRFLRPEQTQEGQEEKESRQAELQTLREEQQKTKQALSEHRKRVAILERELERDDEVVTQAIKDTFEARNQASMLERQVRELERTQGRAHHPGHGDREEIAELREQLRWAEKERDQAWEIVGEIRKLMANK